MKLRIRDNSLRLRLTKSEVERLGELGSVMSFSELGPGFKNRLIYCIESCSLTESVQVSFETNIIRVVIPKSTARLWCFGAQVGIYAEQQMSSSPLKIIIEKDFFCLKPRTHEHENEADMFPNPNVSTGRCG